MVYIPKDTYVCKLYAYPLPATFEQENRIKNEENDGANSVQKLLVSLVSAESVSYIIPVFCIYMFKPQFE